MQRAGHGGSHVFDAAALAPTTRFLAAEPTLRRHDAAHSLRVRHRRPACLWSTGSFSPIHAARPGDQDRIALLRALQLTSYAACKNNLIGLEMSVPGLAGDGKAERPESGPSGRGAGPRRGGAGRRLRRCAGRAWSVDLLPTSDAGGACIGWARRRRIARIVRLDAEATLRARPGRAAGHVRIQWGTRPAAGCEGSPDRTLRPTSCVRRWAGALAKHRRGVRSAVSAVS